MTYKIEFSRAAVKQLSDIPQTDLKRMAAKINKLANNPFPPGHEKLKGEEELYRIRQGDYRVIYSVAGKKVIVLILYRARSSCVNFVERLLRPSALLDLANILKFTAISAALLERKIRCQNSHNLSGRGIAESFILPRKLKKNF